MCYLRVGVGNRKTGMKMTGVCFNYDEFWKDVQKTAECDFHKDDNSPTECYHEKLADIMGEVWKGKKTLPIVFPVTLGIWLIYRSILNFRKANFYSRKVEELSKRYIFFALIQLFTGLFLIVSPLSISVFLLNIIGLIFLVLGLQSFSFLLKS